MYLFVYNLYSYLGHHYIPPTSINLKFWVRLKDWSDGTDGTEQDYQSDLYLLWDYFHILWTCKHGIRFLYLGHHHFHTLRNKKGLRCSSKRLGAASSHPSSHWISPCHSSHPQPNPTSTSFPPHPQLCSSELPPSSAYKSLTMSSSLSRSILSPAPP